MEHSEGGRRGQMIRTHGRERDEKREGRQDGKGEDAYEVMKKHLVDCLEKSGTDTRAISCRIHTMT